MLNHSIQTTINLCLNHPDFKNLQEAIEYADDIYLGSHRYAIRLIEKYVALQKIVVQKNKSVPLRDSEEKGKQT